MQKNRGITPVIIFLVVTAFAGLGMLVYSNWPKELKVVPEVKNSVVLDETKDWKTYRNEKYGFELRYSPLQKISESSYGTISVTSAQQDVSDSDYYGVVIRFELGKFDLKKFIEQYEQGLPPFTKVLKQELYNINGVSGTRLFTSDPNGFKTYHFIVSREDSSLMIHYERVEQEKILSTFKIFAPEIKNLEEYHQYYPNDQLQAWNGDIGNNYNLGNFKLDKVSHWYGEVCQEQRRDPYLICRDPYLILGLSGRAIISGTFTNSPSEFLPPRNENNPDTLSCFTVDRNDKEVLPYEDPFLCFTNPPHVDIKKDFEYGKVVQIEISDYKLFPFVDGYFGMANFVRVLPATDKFIDKNPTSEKPVLNLNTCFVGGCSGELCLEAKDSGMASTCEWKEEYACYKKTKCERQQTGKCGWTETSEFKSCLANPPK
jgi:hypothetical protein